MDKKETICAIVVTHNRKQLLLECLESLLKQTYPLDAIYIIDNASTDGTPQILKEKGYSKESLTLTNEPLENENVINMLSAGNQNKEVRIHSVRMHENTGGAGGFYEGVKRGYEKDYDWLWLMDDDVETLEEALTTMLNYKSISMCIHPRKKYFDNPVLWERHINIKTGECILCNDISFTYEKKWTTVNTGCFEGMLIHRDIISKIGYPDPRFFIAEDDTIYGLLASLYTNVIYIKDICLIKKLKVNIKSLGKRKILRVSDLTLYYLMRNKFLVEKYIKYIFPEAQINHKRYIINEFLRKIIGILFFDKCKISRILMLIKGLINGFKYQKKFKVKVPNFEYGEIDLICSNDK